MLHAIISKSFFSISPSEDLDLDYIQMFERDGKRYLKRLADLDVEHWNALCTGLWAYIDADRARRGGKIFVSVRQVLAAGSVACGRKSLRLIPTLEMS